MTANELRQRFLDFFKSKHHRVVPSDTLVPSDDPTLLFTSAGMNQFKDCFLGRRRDMTRAASCQKCLRTGDLDKVGQTPWHHTFFEMLGNFSFGDYFKPEAIEWAWEFLTGFLDYRQAKPSPVKELCLALPPEELWVSIYQDDEDAATLWKTRIGVPEAKIKRFGDADNFWPANAKAEGPNGPCGPCSEIYVSRGGQDVEIWNLVFTQFNRQQDGRLEPLPKPNIDTGMGLERLTAVMQGKMVAYETELFAPLWQRIERLRDQPLSVNERRYGFAVADHVRAAAFLINDGVLPSNESRGYVLRMLIRKAYRYGIKELGLRQPFLSELVPAVVEGMREPYPEMADRQAMIQQTIEREEQQFGGTLEAGEIRLKELFDKLQRAQRREVSGEEAFKLYDTYGYPLPLVVERAQQEGWSVDVKGFEEALAAQQQRSRANSQLEGKVFAETYRQRLSSSGGKTRFLGYDMTECEAVVKAVFRQEQSVREAIAGDDVDVILSQSPFYGESGGQVGDTGTLEAPGVVVEITDTQWADEALVHKGKVTQGKLRASSTVKARINLERRRAVMRNHTATHILHSVLREILGGHVHQAGSLVAPDRLRFDFTHGTALDAASVTRIESEVNRRIMANEEVRGREMAKQDAQREGALAFFGDKYGEKVRVMTISGYSKEFCGGTHLRHTGEVGPFLLVSEGSIAAGVRRIEAVTGEAAVQIMREDAALIDEMGRLLSRPKPELVSGVAELTDRAKALERELKQARRDHYTAKVERAMKSAKEVHGTKIITDRLDGADQATLRDLVDVIRSRVASAIIVLGSVDANNKVALVVGVTEDQVKRGYDASKLIKVLAGEIGGTGGGRKDLAQAGGRDPGKLGDVLARAAELLLQKAQGKA